MMNSIRHRLGLQEASAEEEHVDKISSVSDQEIIKRLDFKTKVALEELLSLSSFTKKTLLYLLAITTLSVYMVMVKRGN